MKKAILALFGAMALAACGGGPDNVGACNNFVASVKCGTNDISGAVNCQSFANTTCDVSGYFNCLAGHYVCVNGMYDQSKLQTAGDCAAQATCH